MLKVKKNEVWRLGRHRLMCGDSTDVNDIERLMDGKTADMLFTDPPWRVLHLWIPEFTKHLDITNMIIWHKARGGMGDLKHTFSTDYEVALVANQGKEIVGKRTGSVWKHTPDEAGQYIHPTQKPKSLARQAILQTTHEGDLILDLFGGSGTTLIALEQTKRTCYMMELDEKYCEGIINRWELFTKQKAIREEA